jgi:hypothetical protein
MWAGCICSRFVLFLSAKEYDFTGHFQSLDTSFCIDRPEAAYSHSAHRPFCQLNSDRASAHIFVRAAFVSVDSVMGDRQREKAQSLIPDNCGMGSAVGIEMIRETYCAFYRYLCRGGYHGGGFIYAGVRHYWFARSRRKQSRERRMILSANLLWGGGSARMPAQRIGGGAV